MEKEFSVKYKKGDVIYFWLPDYGGYGSEVIEWFSPYNAYYTWAGLYVRETDNIFNSVEELREFEKTHKHNKDTGCGYSFGCDFLE